MLPELDEAIRELLIRQVPLDPAQVDVAFERPDCENVARFSKPTVNLFLFHVEENLELKRAGWDVHRNGDGTATKRWPPIRAAVHYLVSAWAQAVDDEHRLLFHLFRAIQRNPELPQELLEGPLANQPQPVALAVSPWESAKDFTELWSVLDNRMQP